MTATIDVSWWTANGPRQHSDPWFWVAPYFTGQSESYITTDGQSASLSSCEAPSEHQDLICITARQLRVCCYGAPSLTRGWICRVQLLFPAFPPFSLNVFAVVETCLSILCLATDRYYYVFTQPLPSNGCLFQLSHQIIYICINSSKFDTYSHKWCWMSAGRTNRLTFFGGEIFTVIHT
jgi:hypothetical protein